jgi:hypothetical protein
VFSWDGAAEIAQRFLANPKTQGNWMHVEDDLTKRIYLASGNFLVRPNHGPLADMFNGLASGDDDLALSGFSSYMNDNLAWSYK